MEQNKFRQDLTSGSVAKQLIRFSIPFLLSNLLQAFYSVADLIIVGNYSDIASITGVSIGGQVNMLVTGISFGLAVGGTVLIAQFGGAKKFENQRTVIGTMSTLYLILGVVLTAFMLLFGKYLLQLLDTPEEAFPEALRYMNICMLGCIFMFAYNGISAILRGMGDSKRPLYFVMIATITNVVLDIIFCGPLQMAARGAAIATVTAQGLSVLLSLLYLLKNDFFSGYTKKDFRIDKETAKSLIRIGLPSSVQQALVSFSFLTLTALVNSLPNAVVAAACQGIGGRINSFAILPALAMSNAVSSMVGQNIGAKDYKRAAKTVWTGVACALTISLVVFLFVQLFPDKLISIFTRDAEVIATGVPYMRYISIDYLLVAFVFCFNGLFIGAGYTNIALINTIFSAICLRIPLAYFLARGLDMGFNGVGLAIGLATIGSLLLGLFFFLSGRWKTPKIHV